MLFVSFLLIDLIGCGVSLFEALVWGDVWLHVCCSGWVGICIGVLLLDCLVVRLMLVVVCSIAACGCGICILRWIWLFRAAIDCCVYCLLCVSWLLLGLPRPCGLETFVAFGW